jgi:hypothetical protein
MSVSKHLNNIYKTGELNENSTCSILEHMGNDSMQRYKTKYYNPDAIISVGYRVNSINATLFRIWTTGTLKNYLLSKRAQGVAATVYTAQISPQFQLDLQRHNAQYPSITIQTFTRSHDRFLFIDGDVYHIGASLKDLGKKWFAFSKMRLDANTLLQNIIRATPNNKT